MTTPTTKANKAKAKAAPKKSKAADKPIKVPDKKPAPKKSPPNKKPEPIKKPAPVPKVPVNKKANTNKNPPKKSKKPGPGKIKWEKSNDNEAAWNPEIPVQVGTGITTGLRYSIYLLRTNVWVCRRLQALKGNQRTPEKEFSIARGASNLKDLDACRKQCEVWEGEDIVTEEVPLPPAPVVAGEKKVGSQVKERDYKGMSPEFSAKTKSHNPGFPKKIEIKPLIEWLENLISAYYDRGIWLTNTAIKGWIEWLRENPEKNYSVGDKSLILKTLSDCARNRDEPFEWTSAGRQKAIEEKYLGKSEATPEGDDEMATKTAKKSDKKKTTKKATGSAIVMKAKTKSVDIEIGKGKKKRTEKAEIVTEAGTGAKGGARYRILGLPMAAVLRWMGSDGWTWQEAMHVLHNGLGMKSVLASTIKVKVYNGKAGTGPGEIPTLTTEQQKTLRALKAK